MVELQGLPDSWVMRVLSSAEKKKTKIVNLHTFSNATKILKKHKNLHYTFMRGREKQRVDQ